MPDLYSLWFEDSEGRNSVLSQNQRICWVTTPALARRVANDDGELVVADDGPVVYDIYEAVEGLTNPRDGSEMRVLSCLNFLDDLVLQLAIEVPEGTNSTMVQVITRLTEGETLDDLFNAVGGSSKVLDVLYGYVGRVVTHSSLLEFAAGVEPGSPL